MHQWYLQFSDFVLAQPQLFQARQGVQIFDFLRQRQPLLPSHILPAYSYPVRGKL